MKIETKSKRLEVTFPNGKVYRLDIHIQTKKFDWDTEYEQMDDVLSLRNYANELAQIATLVQDELNQVHGYEFNEDVEAKKDEPTPELSEKEKLKAIYFRFYDQMDEPERSEAKANWDYEFAKTWDIPENIRRSINFGFKWCNVKEDSSYWTDLFENKYNHK